MLPVPIVGIAPCAQVNNLRDDVVGDWLESSLLFLEGRLSQSDLVDILDENGIIADQKIGFKIAEDGFAELRSRYQAIGNSGGVRFEKLRAEFDGSWRDRPVEAFFLLLSVFELYQNFPGNARDLNQQGLLFEKVVVGILGNMLPRWQVMKIGWSADDPVSMSEIVSDLSDRLNCKGTDDIAYWVGAKAKDGGLDVVCYLDFEDGKQAQPTLFVQCASGKDWPQKINTPNPDEWQMLLLSPVRPAAGLAAPFVIPKDRMRRAGLKGQILILDRLRLLQSYGLDTNCVDDQTKQDIIEWAEPIVKALLNLTEDEHGRGSKQAA